jgi:hypothetical protein
MTTEGEDSAPAFSAQSLIGLQTDGINTAQSYSAFDRMLNQQAYMLSANRQSAVTPAHCIDQQISR